MEKENKRIVILGGGESGTGSAVLARLKGFDVFLSDAGPLSDKYRALLEKYGIAYEEGGHTPDRILNADEVVKSPGIPEKAEVVKKVRAKGIPVISEIELAGRYTDARIIAVTGSNGKTTTTSLVYELLRKAGFNAGLGGNIGRSFALQVATEKHEWYVLELSSFQLDGMYDFKAHIAVLTNITPDHLDRYEYRMQNYVNSKFRIIRNLTAKDRFVYCADDPETARRVDAEINSYPMPVAPFTARDRRFKSAYLREENGRKEIVVQEGDGKFVIGTDELQIKGIHNIYNVMAAVIAARLAGVPDTSIRAALKDFGGVEHRMEAVAEKDGVLYINDSKATNVDSVWYALESMTRPVIWIAGGTDKGNDYERLLPFVREKVKVLVCLGLNNEKLKAAFGEAVPVLCDTDSLEKAMACVKRYARAGDAVLLSPACASFDLFRNYEDRGRRFKEAVKAL